MRVIYILAGAFVLLMLFWEPGTVLTARDMILNVIGFAIVIIIAIALFRGR